MALQRPQSDPCNILPSKIPNSATSLRVSIKIMFSSSGGMRSMLEAAKAGLRKQRWLDKQRVLISSSTVPHASWRAGAQLAARLRRRQRGQRGQVRRCACRQRRLHGGDDYGGGDDDDNNLSDFSDNNSDGQCGA